MKNYDLIKKFRTGVRGELKIDGCSIPLFALGGDTNCTMTEINGERYHLTIECDGGETVLVIWNRLYFDKPKNCNDQPVSYPAKYLECKIPIERVSFLWCIYPGEQAIKSA